MAHHPGNDDHDDVSDLSALDFSAGHGEEDSGIDALDDYAPPAEPEQTDNLEVLQNLTEEEEEQEGDIYTVSNPQKSVTVKTLMDGRIHRVELTSKVENMTESDLAEEIFVLADLARQKARVGQYEMMMRQMEEDEKTNPDREATALVRELMGMTMNLPTPEEFAATEAEVFATRYNVDIEQHHGEHG